MWHSQIWFAPPTIQQQQFFVRKNRLLTFNEAGDNAGKVVIVLLINISIVDSDTTHYGLYK